MGGEITMRKILAILAVGIFLAATVGSVYAVEVFQAKTELRQYNKALAYPGYTTFARSGYGWLIDMDGNLVHTWEDGSFKLLANGNNYGNIFEMDWDGNYVWGPWEIPEDSGIDGIHHDSWKIFNPKLGEYTYIGVTRWTATNAEIWAAGGDPAIDYEADGRNSRLDGIVEVAQDGSIVWEWRFMEHTVQDQNATWPNFGVIADSPGKNDMFWMTDQAQPDGPAGVVRDWHHVNSLNFNEELDYIAINAKHWSEFYVIDHGATFIAGDPAGSTALAATDAGDFIYRFGNPSAYQQGLPPKFEDEGDQQMYGSHNIQWIREGLSGAGNFLIFNNDCYNPMDNRSEILEINPYLDAAGVDNFPNYVNPPDALYDEGNTSNQIVWSYKQNYGNSFYSNYISGMQRLPNGNTHINAGAHGHAFEVTPDGDVVWEYIQPVRNSGPVKYLDDADGRDHSIFRSMRWPLDHPAVAGRDLTPLGPITDSTVEGALDSFRDSQMGFDGGDN